MWITLQRRARREPQRFIFKAFALFAALFLAFYFVQPILAAPPGSPYNPGDTLSPTCAPGDVNCTVTAPLSGSGTQGYIPFYSASSTVVTSTAALFWDNTNSRLGIGTTTPQTSLYVIGSTTISGNLSLGGTITSGTWNGGVIGVGFGGTGTSTAPLNGQLLIGNGTNYALGNLTGSGLTVTNGAGTIALTNIGVTSLAGTANQITVSNATGTVTLSLPQNINSTSSPTFASTTLSNFTTGSIVFAGAGGTLQQNNANLFWDNTNSRLGIGTSTPSAQLTLINTNSSALTDLLVNPTTKTSGNLLDLQVGGTSQFSVNSAGTVKGNDITTPDTLAGIIKSPYPGVTTNGGFFLRSSSYHIGIGNASVIKFNSASADGLVSTLDSGDTGISVISAGIIGIGTGAAGSFAGGLKLTNLYTMGNVGIGTTTPAGLFHISSTTVPNAFIVSNTNGFIGIGTTTPATPLVVVGTSTIQTSGVNSKGLIVAGVASQSANLQEWQKSDGTVLANINSSGALQVVNGSVSAPSLHWSSGVGFWGHNSGTRIGVSVAGVAALQWFSSDLTILKSSHVLSWSTGDPTAAFGDIGLARNAAGVIEVNSGTAGQYRDLQIRAINPVAGNVGIGTTTPQYALVVGNGTATSSAFIPNGGLCVGGGASTCPANPTPGTIYASSTAISHIDLAENYLTNDSSIEAGDVVSADTANPEYIVKSKTPYEQTLLGIISTAPGVLLGQTIAKAKPVALSGRVPVKVSLENGPIKIGDFLTASSLPGIAMRATSPGEAVGIALENYPSASSTQNLSASTSSGTVANTGKIIAFVKVGFTLGSLNADGSILLSTSTLASATSTANIADAFTSWVGNSLAKLGAAIQNGILTVKGVIADTLTAKKLCLDDVCVNKDQLKALLSNTGLNSSAALPLPASNTAAPNAASPAASASTSSPAGNGATSSAAAPSTSPATAAASSTSVSIASTSIASTTSPAGGASSGTSISTASAPPVSAGGSGSVSPPSVFSSTSSAPTIAPQSAPPTTTATSSPSSPATQPISNSAPAPAPIPAPVLTSSSSSTAAPAMSPAPAAPPPVPAPQPAPTSAPAAPAPAPAATPTATPPPAG